MSFLTKQVNNQTSSFVLEDKWKHKLLNHVSFLLKFGFHTPQMSALVRTIFFRPEHGAAAAIAPGCCRFQIAAFRIGVAAAAA